MLSPNWIKQLQQFGIELAWIHWNRLGVRGTGPFLRCSVDPEALLLLTSLVAQNEVRLWEAMAAWLHEYEPLIQIDRFKRLIEFHDKEASSQMLPRFVTFLRTILNQSQQSRWSFIIKQTLELPLSKEVTFKLSESSLQERLQTHEWVIQNNLLVELRYLFGPSIRADILYYALVISSQQYTRNELVLTTSALRRALYYDQSAIYRTLQSLLKAGVIEELSLQQINEKNKCYCLAGDNRFFGSYARHAGRAKKGQKVLPDLHYVKWMSLVEMVKDIDRFIAFHNAVTNSSSGDPEPLIKNRLKSFLRDLRNHTRHALIPIEITLVPKGPLKDIPLQEIADSIRDGLAAILEFLVNPHSRGR